MSLGSSNMAGTALGMAFSLLLCASIIQDLMCFTALPDVDMARYETKEAVVGQNVTLTCTLKNNLDLKIVNIEWSKNKNKYTKLALFSKEFGTHLFWKNVTMQSWINDTNNLTSSYLHLPEVKEWDSDNYICDVATFPYGSIRKEIELKIKDAFKITCDLGSAVDVYHGENVTIHCRASQMAQFRWTKNEMLVSENESLLLRSVTAVHTGVYTLTVNTENESLHKEFTITVLAATTSLRTDLTTLSPQSYVTEEDVTEPADSSLTTSSPTGLSTTDTSVTWTMSEGADVTGDSPNPSNVTITAGEHTTSFPNYTQLSATSSPATYTDSHHLLNSTTLSYGSTDETRNKSMLHTVHPDDIFSIRPEESSTSGNITETHESPSATPTLSTGTEPKVEETVRSPLAVLIILPVLVLIAVAGYLYRRRIIKQRMALPPPFKPPPPPVKYTAARHCETSTQHFPVSKCNSIEFEVMKPPNHV